MSSAIFITKLSLVFCSTKYSINPNIHHPDDVHVANLRQFLLTPVPGRRGPFDAHTAHALAFPRHASTAIMKELG